MTKLVRVGVMPGKIEEVAVEVGTTVEQVIEIAGLDARGYDVKVDGGTANLDTKIGENTNLVLLVQQVKGNSVQTVRVGMMPGRIQEYAVSVGTKLSDLLEQADLSSEGYDIKVDGSTVSLDSEVTSSTNLVLLVQQVKGNSAKIVRVGVMPGRIDEHAVQEGTKVSDLLSQANLDPTGYDVKVDGQTVSLDDAKVDGSTNLVLLVQQVKGNK